MGRVRHIVPFALFLTSCPSPDATEAPAEPEQIVAVAREDVVTSPRVVVPDPAAVAAQREADERAAFEAHYPMYGVVYHFLAQVRSEPRSNAFVVGYMRRGAQLRARAVMRGDRLNRTGCTGGWYEVPGGGFVCSGEGYLLGATPQTFEPSPNPPALDDALPYPYAYTSRDGVPQFWRVPTPAEELEAAAIVARIEAERALAVAPLADEAGEVDAPPPPGQSAEEGTPDAGMVDADDGGLAMPGFFRMAMNRGFYMSLDELVDGESTRFYRTVRGGYVQENAVVRNTPPETRGVVLGGSWHLPLAIVYRRGAHRYVRDASSRSLRDAGEIERHTAIVVAEEGIVSEDKRYVLGASGHLVRDTTVRFVRPRARPSGVGELDRWIHVVLAEQTLVAYEGDRPVFATLVSTGKPGHETPTGLYRIQSKHVSTTMDGSTADGDYSIEDVPWTMYFNGNYALHGAFWHYTFGQVRSHGCVNLAPADARWLFQWSTPTLPQSWHGVFSTRQRVGTFVLIE